MAPLFLHLMLALVTFDDAPSSLSLRGTVVLAQ